MEDVLDHLPDLSFASDEDSDDADESGDQTSAIFSRSAHLKSLGVELATDISSESQPLSHTNVSTGNGIHATENTASRDTEVMREDPAKSGALMENTDFIISLDQNSNWDRFKSEFSESLQESEERLALGNIKGPIEDLKQQLLLNAILSMHDDTSNSKHHESTVNSDPVESEMPKSPSKLRRSLLSINSLETIHESELDRLLESDSLVLMDSRAADSVEESLVTPPKLVWEREDTGELMKELEKLSKSEAKETRSIGSRTPNDGGGWRSLSNGLGSRGQTLSGSRDGGPIFLDLRPSLEKTKSGDWNSSNERSTSDDESDDPYAWIAQRKHIKEGLCAIPSQLHTTPNAQPSHPHTLLSEPIHPSTAQSLRKSIQNPPKLKTENSNSPNILLTSNKSNEIPIIYTTRTYPASTPTITCVSENGVLKRQRNCSSLTLSSSLSDGEASIGANNAESPTASPTNTSSATSPTKAKKSKKPGKKSKKSRKKDKDTTTVKKDSSRSAQRKLARALVLQRIRNDSLTTSSDEDHCLTPTESESSKLSSSMSSCDALACQGSEEDLLVGMDTEKLKLRLQKIIQSKKPPVQFVTPSTNTVFHEEVSFEAQLNPTHPTRPTDALLILTLSEHGLISLPSDIDEDGELDLKTQLYFHLLLLTWLSSHASIDCPGANTLVAAPSQALSQALDEKKRESVQSERLRCPFWITGLQQTILDRYPSLLVGVAVPSQLKGSRSQDGVFDVTPDSELIHTTSNNLTAQLHKISLSQLIAPILNNSDVQSLIPEQCIENLSQITRLPLSSFLTVQDDISPLNTPLSFYWHSGYHVSSLPSDDSLKSLLPVSTTLCTLPGESLTNHALVFTTLQQAYSNAFYLAGLRIVYGEGTADSDKEDLVLALALRGSDAIYRWLDIVGPEDSNLAKVTDPNSLNAKFGNPELAVLQCIRTPYLTTSTLAKWFGGRACLKTGSVLGISDSRTKFERRKRQRVRFSESESEDGLPSPALDLMFPPLISNRPSLIAQPYDKVLLVVAPLVPPCLYGTVLSTCGKMGFDVLGMKRMRLNSKRASAIHVPKMFLASFTPSSTPPSPDTDLVNHPLAAEHAQIAPPFPSLVLYLGAENSKLHSMFLQAAICSDLKAIMTANPKLQNSLPILSTPQSMLHTTELSHETTKVVGSFSLSTTVSGSLPKLHEERKLGGPPSMELCFIVVPQCSSLPKLVALLEQVYQLQSQKTEQNAFNPVFSPKNSDNLQRKELGGFELLGFKIVPQIPRFYAKRLCPLASSDPAYQAAVNTLSHSPGSLLLFRGLDCIQRLSDLLKPMKPKSSLHGSLLQQQLEIIISKDFNEAFNLSSIFFSDKEIFADSASLGMNPYVPPSWLQDTSILEDLQMPPSPLFSVVRVCMSDARLLVKVLDKLCRSGFRIAAMRAVELEGGEAENVLEDLEAPTVSRDSETSEAGLVMCVSRMNSVWFLQHSLRAFTSQQRRSSSGRYPAVACSESFIAAMNEMKWYFPTGICYDTINSTREYKIQPEEHDSFDKLLLPESCQQKTSPSLAGFVSPLLETTAMVLPPSLLEIEPPQSTAGFVEVIDFLSQSGFEIRGLKMVRLSQEMAANLLVVCDNVSTTQVDDMCSGPCLILVVRRDNAASCCQTIFKSALLRLYRPGPSSVEELLAQIIVPSSAQQAKATLKLLKATC